MSWKSTEEGALARALVRNRDAGVLATMSLELPGYPFGSVTPYVATHEGRLAIHVSDIAQHTKNMAACDHVCLTVLEASAGNPQAAGRVSVVGDASIVPEEAVPAVAARYFAFFPASRAHQGVHGFRFWRIEPRRVRYIGGFGSIFWVEAAEWQVPTPEWADGEAGIIEHMNVDHHDALVAMARHFGGLEDDRVELIAVDPEGCHLRVGDAVRYLRFEHAALTSESVRQVMVQLARAARDG